MTDEATKRPGGTWNALLLCEEAAYGLIPTLWHSGKDEIMGTLKKKPSMVDWGLRGRGRMARRMFMAMGVRSVLLR